MIRNLIMSLGCLLLFMNLSAREVDAQLRGDEILRASNTATRAQQAADDAKQVVAVFSDFAFCTNGEVKQALSKQRVAAAKVRQWGEQGSEIHG